MTFWRQSTAVVCALIAVASLCQALVGWPLKKEALIPAEKIAAAGDRAYRVSIPSVLKGVTVDPARITVRENGAPLIRGESAAEVRFGPFGTSSTTEKSVFFSATDPSDPRSNGRSYSLVFPSPKSQRAWWLCLAALVVAGAALGRAGITALGGALLSAPRWLAGKLGDIVRLKWTQGEEWPLSHAVARVAVGLACWLLSPSLPGVEHLAAHDHALYDPVGPFCFLCPGSPSPLLVKTAEMLLPVAAWLVILGLFTRLSLLVTILSLWVLAANAWLFGVICHGWQPFMLGALPLLVARNHHLSLDGLLRRLMKRAPVAPAGTRLAVLGSQLMIGLVFLSAALHKIWFGNHEFMRWVFSDSLRNLILAQEFVTRKEMHPLMDWMLSHELGWRSLAMATVVCQCLPFIGILLIRRPWLRALCGVGLMIEVASLNVVMDLFPQQFLLMAVMFVHWEYFLRLLAPGVAGWLAPAGVNAVISRGWRWFVTAVIALQAVSAVATKRPVRCLFPFTSFPMFSPLQAEPPWGIHKGSIRRESAWHVESEPPLSQAAMDYLWRSSHELPWNAGKDPQAAAADMIKHIEQMFQVKVRKFTLNGAVFEIEPHPSKKIVLRHEAGFIRHENGGTRAMSWRFRNDDGRFMLDFEPQGFKPASIELTNVPMWEWKPLPVEGPRSGNSIELKIGIRRPGWLIFVTKDEAGREETWAGPYMY